MTLHVRVTSQAGLTGQLVQALTANSGVSNLVVLPGAARQPDGDAVQFDVQRRSADPVLRRLRELGLDRYGQIMVQGIDAAIGTTGSAGTARTARTTTAGKTATTADSEQRTRIRPLAGLVHRAIAPVWDVVEAKIRAEAIYPQTFFVLLLIAALIGAVGILVNSQILIVGAMVVGPEYSAIMGVALGIDKRDRRMVLQGLLALAAGFTAAVIISLLFGLAIRESGHTPQAYSLGLRPVSDLINSPNLFSVVVAVLAGIVGVVSLTEARAGTLIGVFISVTTIPAAADLGLSMAYQAWHEAGGSALQLLLNVVVLIGVGALVLRLQRIIWRHLRHRRQITPGG